MGKMSQPSASISIISGNGSTYTLNLSALRPSKGTMEDAGPILSLSISTPDGDYSAQYTLSHQELEQMLSLMNSCIYSLGGSMPEMED